MKQKFQVDCAFVYGDNIGLLQEAICEKLQKASCANDTDKTLYEILSENNRGKLVWEVTGPIFTVNEHYWVDDETPSVKDVFCQQMIQYYVF